MPVRRQRKSSHIAVRAIDGECCRVQEQFKDAANRTFVVVKFSIIKTLKDDEAGFHLTGDASQLGNWKGHLRSQECPPNSGHHVVYVSLPKHETVSYKWMLTHSDHRTVKEKECNRVVKITDTDIDIQDCFGVYTNILTQIFHPDYHQEDQLFTPVLFQTRHKVADSNHQSVAVIGSTPHLGRWRAINALVMFEKEPGHWATIIYLPKGRRLRYKFVVMEKSKYKRILYGEKRDHRIIVDDDAGNVTEAVRPEASQIAGAWRAATDSAISIEQVEEKSMGSVASNFSLGTKASLGSGLSDITEGDLGVEGANPKTGNDISKKQETLLEELKRELTTDYNSQSSTETGWLTEADLVRLDETAVAVPGSRQRCAKWLFEHDNSEDKDDSLQPLIQNEGELEPLLSKTPPQQTWPARDPFDLTTDWAEITCALDSLDDAVAKEFDSRDENLRVHQEPKPADTRTDDTETTTIRPNPEPLNLSPEKQSTPTQNGQKPSKTPANATEHTGVLQASTSVPSKSSVPKKELTLDVPKVNSSTSLKTSTIQLPCYKDRNDPDADVARKIVDRLPWIRDLPRGLTCKVLNSVGILNKDKQRDIASELTKLNSDL